MNKLSNLQLRVISGIVLLGFNFLLVFYTSRIWFCMIMGLIFIIGAWESTYMVGLKNKFVKYLYITVLAVSMALLYHMDMEDSIVWVVSIYSIIWLSILLALVCYPQNNFWSGIWIRMSWCLISLLGGWYGIIVLWSMEPILAIYLVFLVAAADIGAYTSGKLLGKRKLVPSISPGKTIEGVIGGVLLSLTFAFFFVFRQDVSLVLNISIVTGIVLISIIGDLFISMLKRNAGLKDSGKILPGHGGILDRIDSITAASIPFALFIRKILV